MIAEKINGLTGKPIFDSHLRPVGKLIGYFSNTQNEITAVEIESTNGDLFNCPISHIKIEKDTIFYIQSRELEANNLKKQYDLISRRIRALDELFNNGAIQKKIFDELKSRHLTKIDELNEQKKVLIENLIRREEELNNQITELELFLANSKMQHASDEIDNNAYNIAYEAVDKGFKRAISEKEYIKNFQDFLDETDLFLQNNEVDNKNTSNAKPISENESSPDMVVVRMKKEQT